MPAASDFLSSQIRHVTSQGSTKDSCLLSESPRFVVGSHWIFLHGAPFSSGLSIPLHGLPTPRTSAMEACFALFLARPGARLGSGVLMNDHASLEHGSTAGDFSVRLPYAALGVDAHIADDVFLGLHGTVVRASGWVPV